MSERSSENIQMWMNSGKRNSSVENLRSKIDRTFEITLIWENRKTNLIKLYDIRKTH